MIFGCRPGSKVASDSTLTRELFENLRKSSDPSTGAVIIPNIGFDGFNDWNPCGGRGEIVALVKKNLVLNHIS